MVSAPIFLLTYVACLVLCRAEKQKLLFENNHPGYLYSLGANLYIGKKSYEDEYRETSLVGVVSTPKEAVKMSIVRGSDGRVSFSNIVLDDEQDKMYQDSGYIQEKKALAFINVGAHTRYVFFPLQQRINFYFSFSPVVIPEKNAFQIYTRGGCLAVDTRGLLTFESCIDADTPRRKKQLFRWVNQDWYNTGIGKYKTSSVTYSANL